MYDVIYETESAFYVIHINKHHLQLKQKQTRSRQKEQIQFTFCNVFSFTSNHLKIISDKEILSEMGC